MADLSTCPPLTRASVQAAHSRIIPFIHRTPVLSNATLTALASRPRTEAELEGTRWDTPSRKGRPAANPTIRLWFKCENLQRIGAFKARGAFNAVERLKESRPGWLEGEGRRNGVVTASSGNHAQALALAARTAGIPAHIVMPTISTPTKIAATRALGADVVFSGVTAAERAEVVARVAAETGAVFVPAYDHPDIMLGQGTLGLEMQEQAAQLISAGGETSSHRDYSSVGGGDFIKAEEILNSTKRPEGKKGKKKGLDAIIAPIGGGGMCSGVALSCEGTGILVFGAEPEFEGGDDCRRGMEAGKRIESVRTLTIADGLRTPVGKLPWGVIYERRLVREVFSVTEDEIRDALRLVLERFKLVVEPSAVVGLAVALYNEDFREMVEREAGEEGWDLGVVFSGGNTSVEALAELFRKEGS